MTTWISACMNSHICALYMWTLLALHAQFLPCLIIVQFLMVWWKESVWGTRFPFLAHKLFDINIGWWWRQNHCLLNLDPYLVSHRIWYRYVILLYSFCINSNYTNLNCRGANMSHYLCYLHIFSPYMSICVWTGYVIRNLWFG